MFNCVFLLSIANTYDVGNVEQVNADIVFLMDGSDDMQQSARGIKSFLKEFVEQIDIGPNKAQIAIIQYSEEPTPAFYLNTYSLKRDILKYVSDLKLKGGKHVNTGKALGYVARNVFTSSAGGRAQTGVPQILIILSGRKSQDDVQVPLESLKNAGVVLFSVGMGNADWLEMQSLAHNPRDAYLIKETSDFSIVRQKLLSQVASHKASIIPGIGE